jgi:hypothetical protein
MDPQTNISQNCSVAFLTLTAIALACTAGLLNGQRTSVTPSPAGATSRAGFYVVATTPPAVAGSDLLWIANVYTEQLVVYDTDSNGNIRPLARADLARVFQENSVVTQPEFGRPDETTTAPLEPAEPPAPDQVR